MPKKIDPEVKARAVRLVREHRQEYPSLTAASARWPARSVSGTRVRAPVGAPGRCRRWRPRRGVSSEELAEIKALEGGEPTAAGGRRDLAGGDDFLRRGTRPPQPLIMGFIDTMRAKGHAVESICRVLREQGCQIAARTYRSWRQADRRSRPGRSPTRRSIDAVRDAAWTRR